MQADFNKLHEDPSERDSKLIILYRLISLEAMIFREDFSKIETKIKLTCFAKR